MAGITNPTEVLFKDGVWGYDGTEWQKLNLLFGYRERWAEFLGETKSGAGQFLGVSSTVPEDEIWILQLAFIRNSSGVRGNQSIRLYDGTQDYIVELITTPPTNIPLTLKGSYVLKYGDKIRLIQSTCLDGDVIDAGVWGYKMKITE